SARSVPAVLKGLPRSAARATARPKLRLHKAGKRPSMVPARSLFNGSPLTARMGKIAILTRGLWRLKREVGALSGLDPVRWEPWRKSEVAAIAGWGHKVTADRAR